MPHGRTVFGVAFSPDGRLVAAAGRGGAVVRSTTGQPVAMLLPRQRVYSARFSPHGRFLVTAGADGAIRVWRVSGWRELPGGARILPGLLARAAFTADGRFLVAGGHPGWPNRVWRFRDGRIAGRVTARDGLAGWIERTVERVFRGRHGPVTSVSFSADGRSLVSAGGGSVARVWSTQSWRRLGLLGATRSRTLVVRASISRDGRFVATLDLDGTARIWRSTGGRPIRVLDNVASVASTRMASGS